jgi:hypothetical protein
LLFLQMVFYRLPHPSNLTCLPSEPHFLVLAVKKLWKKMNKSEEKQCINISPMVTSSGIVVLFTKLDPTLVSSPIFLCLNLCSLRADHPQSSVLGYRHCPYLIFLFLLYRVLYKYKIMHLPTYNSNKDTYSIKQNLFKNILTIYKLTFIT